MVFIDGMVVNVALPTLQESLGATTAEVQWVVESYALTLAALLLLGWSCSWQPAWRWAEPSVPGC